MDDKSTFTPDLKTLEYLLKHLESEGVQYTGCTWSTKFQGIRLEDGHLVAENHVTVMAEGKFYRSTLIEKTKLSDGSKFRSLMLIENSAGRDKIGDVFVEVRLDPQDGRYKVRIQMEQVFSDENEYELKPRAVRSSVDNSEQALSRRVVDFPGGIRSNPARISGLRIAQHFAHPGWGVNLDQGEFMDIFDYSDSTDAMGHSTLLKALKYYDAEVADEMYKQMRDPDRRKKVD